MTKIYRLVDKNWEDIVSPWKNEFGYRRVMFMYEQEKQNWAKLIIS